MDTGIARTRERIPDLPMPSPRYGRPRNPVGQKQGFGFSPGVAEQYLLPWLSTLTTPVVQLHSPVTRGRQGMLKSVTEQQPPVQVQVVPQQKRQGAPTLQLEMKLRWVSLHAQLTTPKGLNLLGGFRLSVIT